MVQICWGLLVYTCFTVDLHGGLREPYGLAPALLDLALLAILRFGSGASRVQWGAGIGFLSPLILGTSPALGVAVTASLAALLSFIDSGDSSHESSRPLLPSLGGYLLVTLARLAEVRLTFQNLATLEVSLWKLAGSAALTLLTVITIEFLVSLFRGPDRLSRPLEFR